MHEGPRELPADCICPFGSWGTESVHGESLPYSIHPIMADPEVKPDKRGRVVRLPYARTASPPKADVDRRAQAVPAPDMRPACAAI
jgi:hypothetical protein